MKAMHEAIVDKKEAFLWLNHVKSIYDAKIDRLLQFRNVAKMSEIR